MLAGRTDQGFGSIGMAGVQATVTNLSLNNDTDGTALTGSDAARLMVCSSVAKSLPTLN